MAVLVDRAADLEDLARKVQANHDEDSAALLLRQLERDYLTWHSTALSLLPDDL